MGEHEQEDSAKLPSGEFIGVDKAVGKDKTSLQVNCGARGGGKMRQMMIEIGKVNPDIIIIVESDAQIAQLKAELETYKAIEENSWDLQCIDIPSGGDDFDIGWIVIEHYQAEPKERIVGRGQTPTEAIEQVLKGGVK